MPGFTNQCGSAANHQRAGGNGWPSSPTGSSRGGGFHISGFWTAVGAALVVSAVSWAASGLLNDKGKVEVMKLR